MIITLINGIYVRIIYKYEYEWEKNGSYINVLSFPFFWPLRFITQQKQIFRCFYSIFIKPRMAKTLNLKNLSFSLYKKHRLNTLTNK